MPIGRRLSPQDRVRFRANIPGLADAKRAAVYDVVGFAAAANVLGPARFFTIPLGGAGVYNGAAVAKGLLHTNLRTAGQLPAQQELEVWDIRVEADLNLFSSITTPTILNNAMIAKRALLMNSFFTLQIDGKTQIELSPVAILSSGYGPVASGYGSANITAGADAGGGSLFMTNGSPNRSALWNLNPLPIVIQAGHTFEVIIETPVVVTLPANTALNWWLHLDGVLHRAA